MFVCGNGDLAFCKKGYIREIISAIRAHNQRRPGKTYYLQSKNPYCLEPFVNDLPENVILVTTLETNRNDGYRKVSKAPYPTERYEQFKALDYPRKVVTIEPVMDFDLDVFSKWMSSLQPEYVWVGFNSRNSQVSIPEPPEKKLEAFIENLIRDGIEVRGKKLRGVKVAGLIRSQA